MAQNLPKKAATVISRVRTDIINYISTSNPFLKVSYVGSLANSLGQRFFDIYYLIKNMALEAMPDTANVNAPRWGNIFGVERGQQGPASGKVVFVGSPPGWSGSISAGLELTSTDGKIYTIDESGTTGLRLITISTMTNSGLIATVNTASAHELADNCLVTISGSARAPYNGSWNIRVTDYDSFEFDLVEDPGGTGHPANLSVNSDALTVTSNEYGEDQNQDENAVLTFLSTPLGIASQANVWFGDANTNGGLIGGIGQETTASLVVRYLERIRNPVAHCNVGDIVFEAKKVQGVTRVWVQEIQPTLGQFTVYFMRDNDDGNGIPTSLQVQEVAKQLLGVAPFDKADRPGIVPANVMKTNGTLDYTQTEAQGDVYIAALTPEVVNFVFSALVPDTPGLRSAVEANIAQYFEELTEPGLDFTEKALTDIVVGTVDVNTGDRVTDYTVTTPAAFPVAVLGPNEDLPGSKDEIAVLGTITWT